MKFKHFFLASLFAGLVASCSNDVPMPGDDTGKVLEGETTSYVTISITGDRGTKAPGSEEFENGSGEESMIKNVLLTFFDAGRNFVGSTEVILNEDNSILVPGHPNTVERVKTFIAQVDLPENINYPRYIMAYVNPTADFRDLNTEKLEDVTNYVRKRSSVSPSDDYRTMNNSVYYDETTGNTRYAAECDFKTQFFKTQAEAEEAAKDPTKDATIEITVERMEAKVKTNSINDIKVNRVDAGSGVGAAKYQLTFVPEVWFVNATEKRSFLIKNYRSNRVNYTSNIEGTADFGMSLAALKNAFATDRQNDINSMTNKRSYWAIDPTYFYANAADVTYPDVSYDVNYTWTDAGGHSVIVNGSQNTYPLLYRSYENVLDSYGTTNNYEKYNSSGVKTHEYVLENTMSLQTLNGGDAKASMSSVVLLGYYKVTDNEGNVVFDGSKVGDNGKPDTTQSFYVRHEADGITYYVMINDNEAKDFFLERSGSLFFVPELDQAGDVVENSYVPLRAAHLHSELNYGVSYNDFALTYPSTDVTNGKKQSEQWRTLTLSTSGAANDNIYVYESATNSYKKYNTLSADEKKAFADKMYSSFGVLEKFQAGKAYFNVPLKHIWNDPKNTSNEFKPENVKLGDYGVVRNHVYDLQINSISGLGTGIGDIKQPIVPPTENEKYYINARLNILQWRVVKQSVDL